MGGGIRGMWYCNKTAASVYSIVYRKIIIIKDKCTQKEYTL